MDRNHSPLILIAFRLFTEGYPGFFLSADDLHKLMWDNDVRCDSKTARKVFNQLKNSFFGSSIVIVHKAVERRGAKRVPTEVISIIIGRK